MDDGTWITNMRNIKDHGAVLIGNDGQIAVNCDILIARSEIFAKMFEGEWAEKNGEIKLPYSVEAIRRFYYFVKTGQIDKNSYYSIEILLQLIDLANQYLFVSLVEWCETTFTTRSKRFGWSFIIIDHCYDKTKNFAEQRQQVRNALSTLYEHTMYSACRVRSCDCKTFDRFQWKSLYPVIMEYCFERTLGPQNTVKQTADA